MDPHAIAAFLFFFVLPLSFFLLYFQISAVLISREGAHADNSTFRGICALLVAGTALLCSLAAIFGTVAYAQHEDTPSSTAYRLAEEVLRNILRLSRRVP